MTLTSILFLLVLHGLLALTVAGVTLYLLACLAVTRPHDAQRLWTWMLSWFHRR